MSFAMLFWCYKAPGPCADRLRLLRHHNPDAPIYVLYGGGAEGEAEMRAALAPYADDFWRFDEPRDTHWKWINGDRLIARWHRARGRHLPGWTRLFVVQWDMLVAAPVAEVLAGMPEGAAAFTGRLELGEVAGWWPWVRGRRNRGRLALFRLRLALVERYLGPVFSAPFIVVAAPRAYFDRLSTTPGGTMGFIEYRCPTFAEAWGFPNWTEPRIEAWRPANPATRDLPQSARLISARKEPVEPDVIAAELGRADGGRMFHPVTAPDAEMGIDELLYA